MVDDRCSAAQHPSSLWLPCTPYSKFRKAIRDLFIYPLLTKIQRTHPTWCIPMRHVFILKALLDPTMLKGKPTDLQKKDQHYWIYFGGFLYMV